MGHIKNILIISSFLFLTIVLFPSCEYEESIPNGPTPVNEIPDVAYVEEPLTIQVNKESFSRIVWEISDGSKYETATAEHTFRNSGIYEIRLLGYKGNELVHSSVFELEVFVKHRTVELNNDFYTLRGALSPSKTIILEGVYNGDNKTSILEFDQNLKLKNTYSSLEEINQPIFTNVLLGNNIFNLKDDNSEVKSTGLKSAEDFAVPENFFSKEVLRYSSGIIHYYKNSNTDLFIDYYNAEFTKLWTKSFPGKGKDEIKFIFNNQEILYYVSFDASGDKINIEKFKNISLSYKEVSYNLGIDAQDREILFAYYKPATKTIELAVYSRLTHSTRIFSIDENCEMSLISELESNLNGIPTYTLTDGSVLIKEKSKLVKYSTNWSKLSEINIGNNYFTINRIGDNLFLITESTNNGLRLSYCDKQLNKVIFK